MAVRIEIINDDGGEPMSAKEMAALMQRHVQGKDKLSSSDMFLLMLVDILNSEA